MVLFEVTKSLHDLKQGSNSTAVPAFEGRQSRTLSTSMIVHPHLQAGDVEEAELTTCEKERKRPSLAIITSRGAFFDIKSDSPQTALKRAELLQDSGYHSVLERSAHPFSASIVEDVLSARTNEGLCIVTFPDSRTILSFQDYQTLIIYLLQVLPPEDSNKGFVVVVDRRSDKWSSVRTLFLQITSFFPGTIRVVFLLKPEGVLQRALEVGYRAIVENCSFKVIMCDSSVELRRFLKAEQLTMDIGGLIKYNHLEWVQHRMDIERMKSSASAIAQSLCDFGRVLRETELPNDEEFRISVRKGMALLGAVRQIEAKPRHELLSPTRLQNVTAIERMLVQLGKSPLF
ncbi:unnamed protein product [Angiostrongylus costaricensis]|uniref:CRAL-TRIO domain-containing protein n=1 Tax=Angiostrongylus costaricensis TaxID=334426 RepID=A0A158PF76_ANGCS|nr:unnamed protein product [Angiostrongylus costaricensis]